MEEQEGIQLDDCKQRDGELSVTEAARQLKTTEGYLYGLLRVGRLQGRKTASGRWFVSAKDVACRQKARSR